MQAQTDDLQEDKQSMLAVVLVLVKVGASASGFFANADLVNVASRSCQLNIAAMFIDISLLQDLVLLPISSPDTLLDW